MWAGGKAGPLTSKEPRGCQAGIRFGAEMTAMLSWKLIVADFDAPEELRDRDRKRGNKKDCSGASKVTSG